MMLARTRIAARIAHQLKKLRGTQHAFTVQVGDAFYQAACDGSDLVLLEISAEPFLYPGRQLPAGSHDELLRLGFHRPTTAKPNWWVFIDARHERGIFAAAAATASALLDVYDTDLQVLAEAVGLRLTTEPPPKAPDQSPPTSGEGEPLVAEGTLGELSFFPNGFATLDGQPWSTEPVTDWTATGDRIAITLKPARDKTFPHVAFVENTPHAAAVLRSFTPGRDERQMLIHRLAVAEHYVLTCIVTGTIYHHALAQAVSDVERDHRDYPPSAIVNWPGAQRLAAAVTAQHAFWMTRSADNNRELRHDQEDTWRAIQEWVRLSPWRDDLDFEIMPAEPIPFHVAPGPEVEIQRVYPCPVLEVPPGASD